MKIELGDVVALKRGWMYSASEWFGGRDPRPGDIGIVWYVAAPQCFLGKRGPQKRLASVWITIPDVGKYCVYMGCLKRVRGRLGDHTK